MVFVMSDDAKIEELLMELKSYFDNFSEDLKSVIENMDKCQNLDHANDSIRNDVMSNLLALMKCLNVKDVNESLNHAHAMMQLMTKQERIDLEDDKPRTEARIQLALCRERAVNKSNEIRSMIGYLNSKQKND